MLNVYSISCIIEKLLKFIEKDETIEKIVIYQAILIAYARDEEHIRQLIATWTADDVKIEIKKIQKDGVTERTETVIRMWDKIIGTK